MTKYSTFFRPLISLTFVATIGLLGIVGHSCRQADLSSKAADVAHGRYLVERVGMCQDCHSPRNEKGQYIKEQWLKGTPLPFSPKFPIPGWTDISLPIAGLPSLSDDQARTFLMTGDLPGGRHARPPMPEFRFEEQDARDIVGYLRSLAKPTNQPGF